MLCDQPLGAELALTIILVHKILAIKIAYMFA